MSYNLAKRFSKDKDSFGRDASRACSRRNGGAASGTSALLRCSRSASRARHGGDPARRAEGVGLEPRAAAFVEHKGFVWGLIASMYSERVA